MNADIPDKSPGRDAFQRVAADRVKEYGQAQLAQLDHRHGHLPKQAMARWLVASLVLFNCGMALTVHRTAAYPGTHPVLPWLFVGGLGLAFFNGWAIQQLVGRQAACLARARRYWSLVASGGAQQPEEEAALSRLRRRALREGLAMPLTGLLSAGALAWGYVSLMAR